MMILVRFSSSEQEKWLYFFQLLCWRAPSACSREQEHLSCSIQDALALQPWARESQSRWGYPWKPILVPFHPSASRAGGEILSTASIRRAFLPQLLLEPRSLFWCWMKAAIQSWNERNEPIRPLQVPLCCWLEAGQQHNALQGLPRDGEKRNNNFSRREVSGKKGLGIAATPRRTKWRK